jgi:hypothetical protein
MATSLFTVPKFQTASEMEKHQTTFGALRVLKPKCQDDCDEARYRSEIYSHYTGALGALTRTILPSTTSTYYTNATTQISLDRLSKQYHHYLDLLARLEVNAGISGSLALSLWGVKTLTADFEDKLHHHFNLEMGPAVQLLEGEYSDITNGMYGLMKAMDRSCRDGILNEQKAAATYLNVGVGLASSVSGGPQ